MSVGKQRYKDGLNALKERYTIPPLDLIEVTLTFIRESCPLEDLSLEDKVGLTELLFAFQSEYFNLTDEHFDLYPTTMDRHFMSLINKVIRDYE